jgi:hypothetical protein
MSHSSGDRSRVDRQQTKRRKRRAVIAEFKKTEAGQAIMRTMVIMKAKEAAAAAK